MKLGFSQQQIIDTAKSLGLPSDGFIQRRVARAYDLVATNKVSQIDDGIFRVRSQYEPDKIYLVNVNHGAPYCDCPDGEKTINCKHRIASLLYMSSPTPINSVVLPLSPTGLRQRHQEAKQVVERAVAESPLRASVNSQGFTASQGVAEGFTASPQILLPSIPPKILPRLKVTWDDTANSYHKRGRWWVTDYKRRIKYIIYRDGDGNLICPCGRKPDCEHRKAIREYLGNNGGGNLTSRIALERAVALPRLNECGSAEAKKLQDRLNGNNGTGDVSHPSTSEIDPSAKIFLESDKLDEAQILTGQGDKVHKLSDGSYCISYFGICSLADKFNIMTETLADYPKVGCVTVRAMRNDTKNGRKSIQPVNGSFEIAEGKAKRNAIRMLLPVQDIRALEYKAKLTSEFDWQKAKAKCLELVNDANLSIIIHDLTQAGKLRQDNPSHYDRTEWLVIFNACQGERAVALPRLKEAKEIRDPKSLNRWSYNSTTFLERCREAINEVREKRKVEANEMPLQTEVKRKLQMDKRLKTWLIEADGTKKPISCREIAEQFDSYEKGIIKRLRMGIDSGADFATVELND